MLPSQVNLGKLHIICNEPSYLKAYPQPGRSHPKPAYIWLKLFCRVVPANAKCVLAVRRADWKCRTSPVAETELYFKWLEVTGAVPKGAEWADRAGSTQFSDLIDPARGHSQAAQASAAAKIRTTAANRKLVKFHKDICSQWASSHYQAKQALLATQQRWTFSSLQNETLFSKRPFHQYNFCSMYFCKLCVERTLLRILHLHFFQWIFVSDVLKRHD